MEAALVHGNGDHDSSFPIDPSLDADNEADLFLPEVPGDDASNDHQHEVATLDDAAVSAIKASLSQAQAASRAQDRIDSSTIDGPANLDTIDEDNRTGTEDNPIANPETHIAPYSRVIRDDDWPLPEHQTFTTREMFTEWLEGESSWCHFVQRRTTTPQKRAEERVRGRIKAHEKMLMEMTPDERKHAPPLKRRKRMRTSPVIEKVTFTCHHAGSYSSKHDQALPQSKQRLKTKPSVKCNCPARVVMTELEGGCCKVAYFWRHEGHDPFAGGEMDTGRLPKVVDDWLIAQIDAGKDTDEIRQMLSISEEAKQEYVRKALEDPSSVDPNLPPPLAFQTKIKYPDIYNRFRKLRGPIRAIKIPKCRQNESLKHINGKPSESEEGSEVVEEGMESATAHNGLPEETATHLANLEAMGNLDVLPTTDDGLEHQFDVDGGDDVQLDLSGHAMLAQLASQHGHSDLAQALMRLPSGPSAPDEQTRLEEEVLKMANLAAQAAEGRDDEWGDFGA